MLSIALIIVVFPVPGPPVITTTPSLMAVLIAFFCYCSLETSTGLWAASYLVIHYNYSIEIAASFAAIFYIGITLGRFLCGFISMKMNDIAIRMPLISNLAHGYLLPENINIWDREMHNIVDEFPVDCIT